MFKAILRSGLLALSAAVGLAASAGAQTKTFVFTAIPDQDETRLVERFTKVADYLQQKLGVPVKYLPVKSYPAAVTAFTNNQVQLAWFGGFTGVQARRAVPGSEAIAQGAEDVAFKSYVIANVKTGLQSSKAFPRELAGKSFTFGSRASTSGRLMPEFFFRERFGGKSPEEVFSRVGFSGDHSRTIQLVQSGAYEVGVLDYSVWEFEKKAGKIDEAQVRVIWETPTYPDYNWTVRGDVDSTFGTGFKDKLAAAILAIEDPVVLAHFARSKFIPAKNGDYAPIEEVAKTTGLFDSAAAAPSPVSTIFELRQASVGYDGQPVLVDIDLTVRHGERVVVMGRSGAGKSTLIKLLFAQCPAGIALIPQAAALVKVLSVFHNVYMGRLDRRSAFYNLRTLLWASRRDLDEVGSVLESVDLADKLFAAAGTLSGGQQQRTSVARALYNGRPIVIGDEPVSALDRVQGAEVLSLLCRRHETLVLVLHDIPLALEHADRIIVLEHGRKVLDAPSASLTAADLVPYYGG